MMVSRFHRTFSLVLFNVWLVPGVIGTLQGQETPGASPEAAVPIERRSTHADVALRVTPSTSNASETEEGHYEVVSTTLEGADSETPADPPTLEDILKQWDRIRAAHLPLHIWYRETIRVGSIQEANLLREQGYPEGRTHVSEVEAAIYDGRRWLRPLSFTVDGKQTKSLTPTISGKPQTVEPDTALYGILLNPYPKDCSLSFDGPYAHITAPAEFPYDKTDIWLMPVSGWWVPKKCIVTMSDEFDEDEPMRIESFEWEAKHLKVFGKDNPPRIVDGEKRVNVRTRDAKFTMMTEFEITRGLYARDVVPVNIDPSLVVDATPAPAATVDNAELQNTPQSSPDAKVIIIETTPDIARSEVIRKVVEALEQAGTAKRGEIDRIGQPVGFDATVSPYRDLPYQKTIELLETLKSLGVYRLAFRVESEPNDQKSSVIVQCPADVTWRRVRTITTELEKHDDFKVDIRVAASNEPITASVSNNDSYGVSGPESPRFVPSRTKITVYESTADSDSVRKANAFIRNVSAFTEISFEDWNPDTIDRSIPLLTFVCHGEPDRERIIALFNGLKEVRIPAVSILFRIVGEGKAEENVVIIENSTLLDKPELQSLWDYLKAIPDFGIHSPANAMFHNAVKARLQALDPVGQTASLDYDRAEGQTTSTEIKVFSLKYAEAKSVARMIEQLYGTKFLITVDERTNSVIFKGSAEAANAVEAVLLKLDEPTPADSDAHADTSLKIDIPAMGPAPLALDLTPETLRGYTFPGVDGTNPRLFSFYLGLTRYDESADQLRRQYNDLEQKAKRLVEKLRAPLPNPTSGDRLKSQLHDTVKQSFETRQKLQRVELVEFAERLKGIQQSIELRDKISQHIIDRRIEALLDPNLKWDEPITESSGATPPLRSEDLSNSEGNQAKDISPNGSRRAAKSDRVDKANEESTLKSSAFSFESPATTYEPRSEIEKAVGKLVLVFFQDKSRRAVPCLALKVGEECFAVTTGPASIVPDGTAPAVDATQIEWGGKASIRVEYDPRSTPELYLCRTPAFFSAVSLGEVAVVQIGHALSALSVDGHHRLNSVATTVIATGVERDWASPSSRGTFHFTGLFEVNKSLAEGTPLFYDGKLAGLTLLGTRFLGQAADRSLIVPADRLVALCEQLKASPASASTEMPKTTELPRYSGMTIDQWILELEKPEYELNPIWVDRALEVLRERPSSDKSTTLAMERYFQQSKNDLDPEVLSNAGSKIARVAGQRQHVIALDYLLKLADKFPTAQSQMVACHLATAANPSLSQSDSLTGALIAELTSGSSARKRLVLCILMHRQPTYLGDQPIALNDPNHEKLVDAMLAASRDPAPDVREMAIETLYLLGSGLPAYIKRLEEMVQENEEGRQRAAELLLRAVPDGEFVRETLIGKWAQSQDSGRVFVVLDALTTTMQNEDNAIPLKHLVALLKDENWGLTVERPIGVRKWNNKLLRPELARALAINILGAFSQYSDEARQIILASRDSSNARVAEAAKNYEWPLAK